MYDVDIPEGTIVEGDNTITISVVSGNSGEEFLSPNFVSMPAFECLWDEADCGYRCLIVWSCFSDFLPFFGEDMHWMYVYLWMSGWKPVALSV